MGGDCHAAAYSTGRGDLDGHRRGIRGVARADRPGQWAGAALCSGSGTESFDFEASHFTYGPFGGNPLQRGRPICHRAVAAVAEQSQSGGPRRLISRTGVGHCLGRYTGYKTGNQWLCRTGCSGIGAANHFALQHISGTLHLRRIKNWGTGTVAGRNTPAVGKPIRRNAVASSVHAD